MEEIKDKDYSLEAVPESARKGFRSMFFVMLGFTFFSASMSVGAKLGNGLDFKEFVLACVIGGIILSIYCGILAYIGSDTGLTMDLLCRKAFGKKGSYLSSLVLGFTQIGWFGVGVAMFSIPTAQLLGINEWALTIAGGLLMTLTAATGMKALEVVSTISVPLIVVLGVYSMVTATTDGGGLVAVFAQSAGKISVFTGIGYVIGSFISGGTATPNFIRFAKNNKGRIGQALGKLAKAIGMHVIAFDVYHIPGIEEQMGIPYVEMDELLAQADFISVHAPAVDGGALINAENIAKMKDGVVIINTSRGTNVDEAALLAALESGKVRAAGLDVWAEEPAKNVALYSHPRVSCTPHIGAATQEAQARIGTEIVSVIESFFA